MTPEETAQKINRLRELLKANNRNPTDFEFSVSPVASATPAELQQYRDAGVDELYLTPVFQRQMGTAAEVTNLLEELAHAWVEPAAKL